MNFKRHEYKYYLNDLQTEMLSCKLKSVLKVDSYGSPLGGYRVRSLYFDSIDDECLYQKQSGFLYRKKIRLRTYGDAYPDIVKFEIKHKHGSLVFKESVTIDRESAKRICMGDYRVLLDFKNPVLDKAYAVFTTRAYRPKVIVDYIRIKNTDPSVLL